MGGGQSITQSEAKARQAAEARALAAMRATIIIQNKIRQFRARKQIERMKEQKAFEVTPEGLQWMKEERHRARVKARAARREAATTIASKVRQRRAKEIVAARRADALVKENIRRAAEEHKAANVLQCRERQRKSIREVNAVRFARDFRVELCDNLLLAAEVGDEAAVAALLANPGRPDVDWRDREGQTSLHYACAHGFAGVVAALLAAGTRPNLEDRHRRTPLGLARAGSTEGHAACASLIAGRGARVSIEEANSRLLACAASGDVGGCRGAVEEDGADVNCVGVGVGLQRDYQRDLKRKDHGSTLDVLRSLLTPDTLVRHPGEAGYGVGNSTPLHAACARPRRPALKPNRCVGSQPRPEPQSDGGGGGGDDDGGATSVVVYLLSRGADANKVADVSSGETPLHAACYFGRDGCVAALLGMLPDQQHQRQTHQQHQQAQAAAAQQLQREHGGKARRPVLAWANPAQKDHAGDAPLHAAARAGHAFGVAALLEAGADPTPVGFGARTPLGLARAGASAGHGACAALLAGFKAKVSHEEANDCLLDFAARGDLVGVRAAVEEDGADVNCGRSLVDVSANARAGAEDGWRPLHCAVGGNHSEIVDYLVYHGADRGALDLRGRTPKALAEQLGFEKCARRLRDKFSGELAPVDGGKGFGYDGFGPFGRGGAGGAFGFEGLDSLLGDDGEVMLQDPRATAAKRELLAAAALMAAAKHNDVARAEALIDGHDAALAAGAFAEEPAELDAWGGVMVEGWAPTRLVEHHAPMFGETALHLAAYRGLPDMVACLIGRGANPEARDKSGWTPLHYAAYVGSLKAVEALLKFGADREAKTAADLFARPRSSGGFASHTPLQLAVAAKCAQPVLDALAEKKSPARAARGHCGGALLQAVQERR